MSRSVLRSAIALVLLAGCASAARVDVASDTAITGVNVIPMDSSPILRDQTVIVRNGVITAIGSAASTKIPPAATRIDGANGYLLPGFIDSHVHVRDASELLSYLAYGVTSVVHLSGSTSAGPDILALRDAVARGDVIGPSVYTTGPILDGEPPLQPAVSTTVRSEEEARDAVAAQIRTGADFIKIYNNLSAAALRGAIAAAHDRGVAVFGHIPRVDGRAGALQRALTAGLDVVAHGEEYFFTYFYTGVERQLDAGAVPVIDARDVPTAVRWTKDAGTTVIPNLSFVAMTRAQLDRASSVFSDPEFRFLSPTVREMWRRHNPTTRPDLDRFDRRERSKYPFVQALTVALSNAKVPLLVGTDASAPGLFPGQSVHTELRELVKAGLRPEDAIAAATRTPGHFIAAHTRTISFGTISRRSRADMILFRRNPVEDLANLDSIAGVMVRGRWLTSDDLTRLRIAGAQ